MAEQANNDAIQRAEALQAIAELRTLAGVLQEQVTQAVDGIREFSRTFIERAELAAAGETALMATTEKGQEIAMSAILTAEQVAEIRARAEAATPGPWERDNADIICQCGEANPNCWHEFTQQSSVYPPLGESGPVVTCSQGDYDNSTFIAAARADVPALCDIVEALRAERDAARAEVQRVRLALEDVLKRLPQDFCGSTFWEDDDGTFVPHKWYTDARSALAATPAPEQRQEGSTELLSSSHPLTAAVEGNQVVIRIGLDTLKSAAERWAGFSEFNAQTADFDVAWRITNLRRFAEVVAENISREDAEDGSTPLTRILDNAFERACEDCDSGVEYIPDAEEDAARAQDQPEPAIPRLTPEQASEFSRMAVVTDHTWGREFEAMALPEPDAQEGR